MHANLFMGGACAPLPWNCVVVVVPYATQPGHCPTHLGHWVTLRPLVWSGEYQKHTSNLLEH